MTEDEYNCGSVCVLASGGLDSGVMLGLLAAHYERVVPLFVRCGLAWESIEREALERFVQRAGRPQIEPPVEVALPMDDLYGDHWSTTGREVPDETTADEAVYLPGRNLAFLTKAAIYCGLNRIGTIALGPLRSNPFPDASAAFFRSFEQTAREALGHRLKIITPLAEHHKAQVVALGMECALPLEATFSCMSPRGGVHCGHCNKCHERAQAFQTAGIADKTLYAR